MCSKLNRRRKFKSIFQGHICLRPMFNDPNLHTHESFYAKFCKKKNQIVKMGGKDIFVQICTTFFPPILTVSFFGKIQRSIWTISSQFCNLYVEIYQIIVKIRSHKFSKIVNRKGKPLSSRVSKKSCTKLCNVLFFNTL